MGLRSPKQSTREKKDRPMIADSPPSTDTLVRCNAQKKRCVMVCVCVWVGVCVCE